MASQRKTPRSITMAGFALAFVLLVVGGVVAYRSQRLYQQTVALEGHTHLVLEAATDFLNHLLRGESDIRGYALTGDPTLGTDGRRALDQAWPLLDSLRTLTRNEPLPQARLDSLLPLADLSIALIRRLALLRDSADALPRGASALITSEDEMMRLVLIQVRLFKGEEEGLLDQRTDETEAIGLVALLAAVGGVGLALVILLAATSITLQELGERERVEQELQLDAERQAVVIEMQQAIATARVGDQHVMGLVLEQVMTLSGAGGAAFVVVEGDQYVARSARGDLSQWLDRPTPLHGTIVAWVLEHREATMVRDSLGDPRIDPDVARRSYGRSMVVLPVLDGETAVGLLMISSAKVDAFTTQDFVILKILGGILSAGITNAAAFEANERLLAELRQSRDAAEDANRAKSAFLATMSHELRTPLNSVIGFANLLRRNRAGNLEEKDLQFLDRIRDNGVHLLELINDILDVSKIEAGRMEVRPVPTDLAPVLHETVAQLGGQPNLRAIDLRVVTPERLLPVEVDPGRFKQVLINLIANALKFTEQGSVTVEIVADQGGRPLRIDVTDTGVGIAPDRLEAIFEAFTQAEATTQRRYGGTGLGLTISRSLLRMMGADLTVRSTVGQGSTFSITFPASAARGAADQIRRHTPVPTLAKGPPPLILVIDDEAEARTLLRSYLEDDGYRTIEAPDGAVGLAQARAQHPALITLDMKMPEMNGVEFLRQLRADPQIAGIPVLVVSIEASEHRGSLVGAVDVLPKPVERDGLLGVVQRILPTDRRRVLVVDDDVHTRQLFAAVLGAEGYQVRTARDGLEAFTAIEAQLPDLILLDLMMPVMSGGTFLATLRRNPRYSSVPVVVVTAADLDGEAVRRLDGAAHAVVQKGPALEQTLRELLHSVLGGPT